MQCEGYSISSNGMGMAAAAAGLSARLQDAVLSSGMAVDCLINNAGLQTPPDAKMEDGFEV